MQKNHKKHKICRIYYLYERKHFSRDRLKYKEKGNFVKKKNKKKRQIDAN